MPKTIVILGAGYAGLPAAHYILKHQAAKLDLKVLLISPAEDYYWPVATPRAIIPDQMADDKIFYSIPTVFAKYPSSRFEFVLGKAEAWSPDKSSVLVAMNDGSSRTIEYHTIIVATGSRAMNNMPWKLVGDSATTHAALAKLRDGVKKAKSIVIGGGGATGVEVAGELGYTYAKAGKKNITLITSDTTVLEKRILDRVRTDAHNELKKLKVNLITSTKVTNVTPDAKGATILELTKLDGTTETIETDLFVPTWGMNFNSDFAPADMRLPNGRLKVTGTMQASGYENAFIVGDVADCEPLQIIYAESQVKHVVTVLDQYFTSGGKVPDYVLRGTPTHVVSVGPGHAAGHFGSWKIWGWLLWYFKARTLGTDYALACAEGEKFIVIGSL
ncbi:hypothetical protein G7Z17_g8081 [Cylindrodendrum hubeiense]|uniref:FAD/NAD(P)-binding domain-containing protein n=1 Tax=Cylindrodendrum hubeiense TaxID=595255 RepID=A0A9P5H4C4_9HYPO|nr:hypothetical protein G7Z17_g8081 [Cylindrodendrum hubeiense]